MSTILGFPRPGSSLIRRRAGEAQYTDNALTPVLPPLLRIPEQPVSRLSTITARERGARNIIWPDCIVITSRTRNSQTASSWVETERPKSPSERYKEANLPQYNVTSDRACRRQKIRTEMNNRDRDLCAGDGDGCGDGGKARIQLLCEYSGFSTS